MFALIEFQRPIAPLAVVECGADKFRKLVKATKFAQNLKNGSPGTYSGRMGQSRTFEG